MANMKQILMLLVTTLTVSTWVQISMAAKKPVLSARVEDIPYIKCQVCEMLAKELHQQVQKKQAEILPKKITEYQIIEIAENVCNLKKQEADWIMRIDIVEKGDKLELVEQNVEGQCNSECKTIEKACEEVIGYADTDIAEYIYSSKPNVESLVKYFCRDLASACVKKPPPVPKDRIPGEPFEPKPSKDLEMEKLMKSMQGMPGAPNMQMYSREELMNMKNFGNEDDDDDDDEDEDDENNFRSNLAKAMRENQNKKDDWKEKISKGIKSTSQTLKKHANKVSNKIRQWWEGSKATQSNKKSRSDKAEL